MDLHLPTSGSVKVTNTTLDKNTDTFVFQDLVVGGLFNSSSPVCPLLGDNSVQITSGSDEGSYCWVSYGSGEYIATEDVNAGSTFSIAIFGIRSVEISTQTANQIVSDISAGPILWGLDVAEPFWGFDESNNQSADAHTPKFTDNCILNGGTELFALSDGSAPVCAPTPI
jgi:hypothetical protein